MTSIEFPLRRFVIAGGFAIAVAIAPAVGLLAGTSAPSGTQNLACDAGLEEDPYTYACVPHTVPGGVGGDSGAPSEQELTSCSGGDRSDCLEQNLYGTPGGGNVNVPTPDTTVHQSR